MFLLVIFSLVTLVDPLPTSFPKRVESHSAPPPPQEKLANISAIANEHNNNGEAAAAPAHLFSRGHISREASFLPRNHAHKNVTSLVTTAIVIPLSISKGEKINSDAISKSVENGKAEKPVAVGQYNDKPLSPLVLKLDRRYTPVEIAEYIFTTGDEKGFAQGVAEMLEDGQIMTSRDDVLVFLEAVQKELANLKRNGIDTNKRAKN